MTINRSKRSNRGRVAQIVGLECRQLLAAWASMPNGVWAIRGTDRGDTYVVETEVDHPSRAALYVNGKLTARARLRDISSIRIDAAGGNDRVTVNLSERGANVSVFVDGGWGHDTLTGGRTADELHGGLGNDSLSGRDGNDTLLGDHGDDQILGGAGDDRLQGNLGQDKVDGGLGRDQIDGGRDDDQLFGSGGRDSVNGSAGVDLLDGGSGRDVMAGGSGMDRIIRTRGRDYVKDSTAKQVNALSVARLGQVSSGDLVNQLIDRAVDRHRTLFGQPTPLWSHGLRFDSLRTSIASADSTSAQQQGVDEADVLETDGRYFYSLDSDELHIIDATGSNVMSKVSTTKVNGTSIGLYLLEGDRLVVISSSTNESSFTNTRFSARWSTGSMHKLTSTVRVTTYDVSDKAAPVAVGHTDFDGMYVDSRAVGSNVFVVTGANVSLEPQSVSELANGETGRYETEEEFRARALATVDEWMPGFTATRDGQSTTGDLLVSENLYLPEHTTSDQFATVSLLDGRNAGNGIVDNTSVAGSWVNTVYATDSALYLAGTGWDGETSRTSIAKVGITESSVDFEANGEVEGTLLNQFSLDETDGRLRLAVTQGSKGSAILVLAAQGDTLGVVGEVTGLAPGEQIFSASFDDDRAYLVTYRQVDPLFVVDLSDATSPTLAGELKIPGVSHRLVPISDHYVIGIGNDGDETGRLGKMQVSLFDVSNAATPQRVSTYTFEDTSSTNWWMTSQTIKDHLGIKYYEDEGLLALPVNKGADAYTQLIRVDTSAGTLTAQGTIDNASAVGTRTVKLGSKIYAVDADSISTYSLDSEQAGTNLTFNPGGTPVYSHGGWGWWGTISVAAIDVIWE